MLVVSLLPACRKPVQPQPPTASGESAATESPDAPAGVTAHMSLTTTYTKDGILMYTNGPLRFASAESGETFILCDKPDCPHEPQSILNPNPTCLAQVSLLHSAVLWNNRQILICRMEDNPLLGLVIYQADINGHNRRKIAEIPDADTMTEAVLYGDLLVMTCMSRFYMDDMKMIAKKQNETASIVILDLSSGETRTASTIEAETAFYGHPYVDAGKVYYAVNLGTTAHARVYDIETRTETQFGPSYNPMRTLVNFADGYFVMADEEEIRLLSYTGGGEIVTTAQDCAESMSMLPYASADSIYLSAWVGNGNVYYKYDGKGLARINETPVNLNTLFIFDKIVFVSGYKSGEFFHGAISRDDYEQARYENVKTLAFPNLGSDG